MMKPPGTARRPHIPFAIALIVPTAILSVLAAGVDVFNVDVDVALFVQDFPEVPFRWIADFGNWAGSSGVGIPVTVLVVTWLLVRENWNLAAIAGIATLARLTNGLIKSIFDSPRPTDDLVGVTEFANGLGFPSGHAMGSMLTYGALVVIAERLIVPGRPRRLVQAGAIAIILFTGWGRIYVGAHWPSDVLGGFLWGYILLVVIVTIIDRIIPPGPGRPVYSRLQTQMRRS